MRELRGPEKAVVLLLSLDEPVATQVLSQMGEEEVRSLRDILDTIKDVPPEVVQSVHDEFMRDVEKHGYSLRGGTDYLRRLATRAFGPERATKLLQQPKAQPSALARIDTITLAGFLSDEHPQTIAAILAHLEPERAADTLGRLPEDMQLEVSARIADLAEVPRQALEEAEQVLALGLATAGEGAKIPIDGARRCAAIMNRMNRDITTVLLERLGELNPEQAQAIKRAMFTFEDLNQLTRRDMQVLLKEVSSEQLVMSMKTASEELREKILSAISKRAAQMLRDDLEALGPVRITEVERAQQEIAETALRLQSEGKLAFAGSGGEQFV